MSSSSHMAAESAGPVVVVAPRQTVHWVIAGLLALIAAILVARDGSLLTGEPALAQQGMLGARGLFAFTGQLDKTRYGLFMMDVDAGTVWCYEYNPIKGRMKLAAARSFRFDRYLENLNQDEPTPEQVSEMLNLQRQARLRAVNLGSAASSSPAEEAAP